MALPTDPVVMGRGYELYQVSYDDYHQTFHSSLFFGTGGSIGTQKGDPNATYPAPVLCT